MIMKFNKTKKFLTFTLICLFMMFFIFGCAKNNENVYRPTQQTNVENSNTVETIDSSDTEAISIQTANEAINKNLKNKRMVVVYFSMTGNTENVAQKIADTFNIDAIKIEPKVPYTDDDLDFNNSSSRSAKESRFDVFGYEEEDEEPEYIVSFGIATPTKVEKEKPEVATALPEIQNINVNKYNIIFLGYPIWYNDAPKVIYSFVKNLKNKTLIPFCTSGSTPIKVSEEKLANYADLSVQIMSGRRLTNDTTEQELFSWLETLSFDIH